MLSQLFCAVGFAPTCIMSGVCVSGKGCVSMHGGSTGAIQGEAMNRYDECCYVARTEGERVNPLHQSAPL